MRRINFPYNLIYITCISYIIYRRLDKNKHNMWEVNISKPLLLKIPVSYFLFTYGNSYNWPDNAVLL